MFIKISMEVGYVNAEMCIALLHVEDSANACHEIVVLSDVERSPMTLVPNPVTEPTILVQVFRGLGVTSGRLNCLYEILPLLFLAWNNARRNELVTSQSVFVLGFTVLKYQTEVATSHTP